MELWVFADESLWKSFVIIQLFHGLHRYRARKPVIKSVRQKDTLQFTHVITNLKRIPIKLFCLKILTGIIQINLPQKHSRSNQKRSIRTAVQSFPRWRFIGELHNTLPGGSATVVHDNYGALNRAEHGKGLLQELVGDELRKILHWQRRTMGGETYTDLTAAEQRIIQFSFGDISQCFGFLRGEGGPGLTSLPKKHWFDTRLVFQHNKLLHIYHPAELQVRIRPTNRAPEIRTKIFLFNSSSGTVLWWLYSFHSTHLINLLLIKLGTCQFIPFAKIPG